MKEIDNIKQDKLVVSAEKPVLKQTKLLGSLKIHKGQSCFQLHVASGVVTKAEYQPVNADFKSQVIKRNILIKEGHLYAVALNKENAQKKFIKMLLSV